MSSDPAQLEAQAKAAFAAKRFSEAADLFREAAEGYRLGRSALMAAEMMNNVSVCLLQAGDAQGALDAASGTEEVFASNGDLKRQGMAVGNLAAALDELKRYDDALAGYERSADLFSQAGEDDLRSLVLKSAAGLRLKTGRVTESAFKMIGSLEAKQKPSFFERILKFLLRIAR